MNKTLTCNDGIVVSPDGYWFDRFIDYNPYNVPDGTIRFKFSDLTYDPTSDPRFNNSMLYVWSQISASPNIWDCIHYSSATEQEGHITYGPISYYNAFTGAWDEPDNLVECISFNTKGIGRDVDGTYVLADMFNACTSLTKMCMFDAGDVSSTDSMFYRCESLVEFPEMDFPKLTDGREMFYSCWNLPEVILHTPVLTIADSMFARCFRLTSVELDTDTVTHMGSMFARCLSLEQPPKINTHNALYMDAMFSMYDYESSPLNPFPSKLKTLPNYDYSSLTSSVQSMFRNAINVESGITREYNKLSSISGITNHTNCFSDCGTNTASGAAELAQIPSDWK